MIRVIEWESQNVPFSVYLQLYPGIPAPPCGGAGMLFKPATYFSTTLAASPCTIITLVAPSLESKLKVEAAGSRPAGSSHLNPQP